jgi:type IV secretory pathway VirB2 component (pilin)
MFGKLSAGCALVALSVGSALAEVTDFETAVTEMQTKVSDGLTAMVTAVVAVIGIGAAIWGVRFAWRKLRSTGSAAA